MIDTTIGFVWGDCPGQSVPTLYGYDNDGNRTTQGGTYGTGNRVLTNNGSTYTHDLDENIIHLYDAKSGKTRQYTWSSDGRLTDGNVPASKGSLAFHYDYNSSGVWFGWTFFEFCWYNMVRRAGTAHHAT